MSQNLIRAQAFVDVGRYAEAKTALATELQSDPESWRAHSMLAVVELRQDRPDAALSSAARAARYAPNQELPHRLCAAAYLELGHGMKALTSARQAVELAPSSWATHAALATCLVNRRTKDDRVAAYQSALVACELAPTQPEAHVALARVCNAMGNRRAANRSYRRALELDPENLEAIHGLGINEVNAGRVSSGAGKIRSAAAAAPQHEILRVNTQDAARIWLWRVVDLVVVLLVAQCVTAVTIGSQRTQFVVSLSLTAVFMAATAWSFTRLDPLVRRLMWRFQFGTERAQNSQTQAKVALALGFLDAATLATPAHFFLFDLAGIAIVVMTLGRWRTRAYDALRQLWRQLTHRRALTKRLKAAATREHDGPGA